MTNDLTTKPRLMTPATVRNKAVLLRCWSDGRPAIADNDKLVPAAECQQVIEEMERAIIGCTGEMATEMTRKILGAYPNARPDDPDAYTESVALAVAECPADLLPKLYQGVLGREGREKSFPPVHGEIKAIVLGLVEQRRRARDIARSMLLEHRRRGTDKPSRKWADLTDEEKAKNDERMAALKAKLSDVNLMPLMEGERRRAGGEP